MKFWAGFPVIGGGCIQHVYPHTWCMWMDGCGWHGNFHEKGSDGHQCWSMMVHGLSLIQGRSLYITINL